MNLNLFDDSIGQFAWDLRRLIVVWRAGCVDPSSMWRRGGGSGGAFCACVVLAACAESAGAAAPVRVLSKTATSVSQYISLVIPTIVHLEYVQGVWIKC